MDTFKIPALSSGQFVEQIGLTKKSPEDSWPLTFSLTGENMIIAIVDVEDRVEESEKNCGHPKAYRDRFSAQKSRCDNVAYVGGLHFLPTPVPTPTPSPTPSSIPDN